MTIGLSRPARKTGSAGKAPGKARAKAGATAQQMALPEGTDEQVSWGGTGQRRVRRRGWRAWKLPPPPLAPS